MTLDDVQRLNNHWRNYPPLRSLVSAVAMSLGVKLPEAQSANKSLYMNAHEARALLHHTGGRVAGLGSM